MKTMETMKPIKTMENYGNQETMKTLAKILHVRVNWRSHQVGDLLPMAFAHAIIPESQYNGHIGREIVNLSFYSYPIQTQQ